MRDIIKIKWNIVQKRIENRKKEKNIKTANVIKMKPIEGNRMDDRISVLPFFE